MSISRNLSYVSESPRWFKKMAIGGFFSAIPLVSAIANGYQIQTLRNILAQQPQPLPEWTNISDFAKDGIKVTAAKYILNAPFVLLGGLIAVADFFYLWSWVASWIFHGYSSGDIEAISWIGRIALLLVNAAWASVIAVIMMTLPVMVLRCAQGASFLSLFNIFSHARFIFANFRSYVVAQIINLLLAGVFSVVAGSVGGLGVITVIVPLVSWYVYAVGKFWRRLIWANVLAEAELAEAQKAALRGDTAGPPSGASGAAVLGGLFVGLMVAIVAVLLLLVLVTYAFSSSPQTRATPPTVDPSFEQPTQGSPLPAEIPLVSVTPLTLAETATPTPYPSETPDDEAAQPPPTEYQTEEDNPPRSASIRSVRVDINGYQDGEQGLIVYSSFSIDNSQNEPYEIVARLKTNGSVQSFSRKTTPNSNEANYSDFGMFIAYSRLPLTWGNNPITVDVSIDFQRHYLPDDPVIPVTLTTSDPQTVYVAKSHRDQ